MHGSKNSFLEWLVYLYKDYCKTMSKVLDELANKPQSYALINGKVGTLFAFYILWSLYNPSEDSLIKI